MCSHEPQCPSAGDTGRVAAHVIAGHTEQGWSLLCNGIVLFDDGGLLLPDGRAEAPHTRPVRQALRGSPGGRDRVAAAPPRRRPGLRHPHRLGRHTPGQVHSRSPGQDIRAATIAKRRERMFAPIAARFVLVDTEGRFWIRTVGAPRDGDPRDGALHQPAREGATFAATQSRQNSLPSMSCIRRHDSL